MDPEDHDRTGIQEGLSANFVWWPAPGRNDTAKQASANERLLQQAILQEERKCEIPRGASAGGESMATRKLAPFHGSFLRRSTEMEELFNRAVASDPALSDEQADVLLGQVVQRGDALVRDICQIMRALEVDNLGAISGCLPAIYTYKAKARSMLGDREGTIDDATEGLFLNKSEPPSLPAQQQTNSLLWARGLAY